MLAAEARIRAILSLDIHQQVRTKNLNRSQWAEIEARYVKQRTWRKVAPCTALFTPSPLCTASFHISHSLLPLYYPSHTLYYLTRSLHY